LRLVRRLLWQRCLGRSLLLLRHFLLLLRLRRRRLLLLDRRRTCSSDGTAAGRRFRMRLLALTVGARRLVVLDLGIRRVVGNAGSGQVLSAVVPGLILRTGRGRALWPRRPGALGRILTLFRAHLDAGG
jgi:hypothetical protein